MKEALLDALLLIGGSATTTELAIAISREKRVRDVREHLDERVDVEGILRRSGDRYHRHRDTGVWLKITREVNGEAERDELQEERHTREREAFQLLRKLGQVPTRKEEAKRRARISEIRADAARIKRNARKKREEDRRRERQEQEKKPPAPEQSDGFVPGEPVPFREPESVPEPESMSGAGGHPLSCECDECLFPVPRYAKP